MFRAATCWSLFNTQSFAQNVGTQKTEQHPVLAVRKCTTNGCVEETKSVVIDSNWRWTHTVTSATNCYTGNEWDASLCPDAATCTANCAIEGANAEYKDTYGVHASGSDLQLNFVTQGPYSTNIGSRVYLLEDEHTYKMFQLKNKEFTFDVDVSNLPCGLNGALYFVQMDADGGMSKYPSNKAGAKYGTGYCDAQCPHDIKFIGGEANSEGWEPSSTDKNSGTGKYGSCCTEFDVWEANSISTAYTAHACNVTEQTRCEGVACGDNDPVPGGSGGHRFDGVCDKNGCDFQPFRLGNQSFWGAGSGFVIDTTKPVRVTTQFLTNDNTDSGRLVEIKRTYRQGDTKIETPSMKVGNKGPFNSLSVDYCQAELDLMKDGTNFLDKGGFDATDLAFEKGMVLALSLWDDHYANMLWLDSSYPPGSSAPGALRGVCDTSSGDPKDVESQHAGASVRYMNIAYGELGSTDSGPIPAPSPPAPPGPGPSPGPVPPSPPHQCGQSDKCNCSPGMNNDGRNMEDSARRAADEGDCCNMCQEKVGCVGWTYIPSSGNECWLKDVVGTLRSDGNVISGSINGTTPVPGPSPSPPPAPGPPQQCGSSSACVCSPAKNNNGHNMQNAVQAGNQSHCCDLCQQTSGCVGWTFIPKDGNACWLKDEVGDLTDDGYVTSGHIGTLPPPTPVPVPVPVPPTPVPVPVPVPPTPVPVPVPPSPSPSGCPGGSLDACIDLCPMDDKTLFTACVKSCQRRCPNSNILL